MRDPGMRRDAGLATRRVRHECPSLGRGTQLATPNAKLTPNAPCPTELEVRPPPFDLLSKKPSLREFGVWTCLPPVRPRYSTNEGLDCKRPRPFTATGPTAASRPDASRHGPPVNRTAALTHAVAPPFGSS